MIFFGFHYKHGLNNCLIWLFFTSTTTMYDEWCLLYSLTSVSKLESTYGFYQCIYGYF